MHTDDERIDETARRILNLLFILNASTAPLTTEQIVGDADLGYGSPNRDSDKKKFKRDREKLREQGVVVREIKPAGASENEESSWAIDRARTHAAVGLVSAEDAEVLDAALAPYLARTDIPYRAALAGVRAKLRAVAGGGAGPVPDEAPRPDDPVAAAVWSAFARRLRLTFAYADAAGNESKRTVAVYGIFTQDGRGYFVGHDDRSGQVRTFRIDRVRRAWRPRGSYAVPAGFSVSDYLFLPFDLAGEHARHVPAAFSFPAGAGADELASLTNGRGSLTPPPPGGRWRWDVEVRDVDAAARMALAHTALGMRPEAPDALRAAWRAQIEKAVDAHVA